MEHRYLLGACNNPQHLPGTVDDGIGQCHALPALIRPSDRDVGIGDVQHWIAGDQRSSMTVWSQAEVDEIEYRLRSGELPQSFRVLRGRSLQIGKLPWHGANLFRGQRRVIEKALAQMREIPVGMPGGSNPLVDLNDMNCGPRHVRGC